jgi:hypothetical protein
MKRVESWRNNEATRPEFEIVVEGVMNAFQFARGKEF